MGTFLPLLVRLGGPSGYVAPDPGGGGDVDPTPTANTAPIIIVKWGESNARGLAFDSDATSDELAVRSGVDILHNTTFLFEPLDIGTNNRIGSAGTEGGAPRHGIELQIANRQEAGTFAGTNKIYMVACAQGGTLSFQWYKNNTDFAGTDAFNIGIDRIRIAKDLLFDEYGIQPRIFMFYTQGLNDMFSGYYDTAPWKDVTKKVIVNIRAELGTFPIIMTKFFDSFTSFNSVMDEIASELPQVHTIVTEDATLSDLLHFDYNGYKLVADRFLDTIKANYDVVTTGGATATPNLSAPTVVSRTVKNSTTIRVVFSKTVNLTSTGFSAKKNGTNNPITAVKGAGTTWDLTVSTIVGSDTVLLSYDAGAGNTVDSLGNEVASFTDSAVTNDLPVYIDFDFTGSEISQSPSNTFIPNVADTFYGHRGVGNVSLGIGADGSIKADVDAATEAGNGYWLGFHTSNTPSSYSTWAVAVRGAIGYGYQVFAGGESIGTRRQCIDGEKLRVRIERSSNKAFIEKSSDGGILWSYVFEVSGITAAQLYPQCDIYGGSVLKNPMQEGLS